MPFSAKEFAEAARYEADRLERLGYLPTECDAHVNVVALRLAASSGWQPMDSAPSDGRLVGVYGGVHTKPEVREADGEWWRHEAARGNKSVPTRWCELNLPAPSRES